MIHLGIISSKETPYATELKIDSLIKYALTKEKVNAPKNELLKIYNAEIQYLEFIEVVD